MRRNTMAIALIAILLVSVPALGGCSPTAEQPAPTAAPAETPQAASLDAAIATATQSVSDSSAYIMGLKQEIPGAPPNDDLEKLTTTLNLAATQTGAAQVATAQNALDQFVAGIAKTQEAAAVAPQDEATQGQYRQLTATLDIGRRALDEALR